MSKRQEIRELLSVKGSEVTDETPDLTKAGKRKHQWGASLKSGESKGEPKTRPIEIDNWLGWRFPSRTKRDKRG